MASREPFSIVVRAYYEDTDAGGVVYYANYLRYIERCRSEWLIAHGMPINTLEAALGAVFIVSSVNARYLKPARLMDELTVTIEVGEVRRVQFVALQTVSRGGERLFEAEVRVACVDRMSFKPMAFPEKLKNLLLSK